MKQMLVRDTAWGSWTKLVARSSAAPKTRNPGQPAHAESARGGLFLDFSSDYTPVGTKREINSENIP